MGHLVRNLDIVGVGGERAHKAPHAQVIRIDLR